MSQDQSSLPELPNAACPDSAHITSRPADHTPRRCAGGALRSGLELAPPKLIEGNAQVASLPARSRRTVSAVCLAASMVLFTVTVVAGTASLAKISTMHSGGVAGFAVMGMVRELLFLCALGFVGSLALALVAAIEIRAAVLVVLLEAVVGALCAWLVLD